MTVTISPETNREFISLMEDTLEFFCNEQSPELISGETALKMMSAFAEAKLAEFN